MDIITEREKIIEKMKDFNFMLGKKTHFIISDFRHPKKKKVFNKTTYYFFNGRVISKDSELIPYGKHTIQVPSKRFVLPLMDKLEAEGRINDKKIAITAIKKSNFNFEITIHKS